jgi:hypothetical protein
MVDEMVTATKSPPPPRDPQSVILFDKLHPMPQKRTHIRARQKLELALTTRERRAILDHILCLPPEYATLLRKTPADTPLLLTLDDLDDFSGYVAAESNHTPDKRLRTILDSAFRKMTALLDAFTDEGPPVTRPTKPTKPAKRTSRTKRALAAEHDLAQWRETSSDQAAFLATWAATALRLAEQNGTKDENLPRFVLSELDQVVLSTLPGVTADIRKRVTNGKHSFTRAEASSMVMAIAQEFPKAHPFQQVGLLMTAMSLMAVVEAKPGDPPPNVIVQKFRPAAPRKKAGKKSARKTAARKPRPNERNGDSHQI